jgi:hypothetical protein
VTRNHQLIDDEERNPADSLQEARDYGSRDAESAVHGEENVVVFPGEQAALTAHEDGEEEAEEDIEREGKDKQRPRLVFLVAEHPDDGEEEGQCGNDGGVQEKRKQAHVRFQPIVRRYCVVAALSV